MGSQQNQGFQPPIFGKIPKNISQKLIFKNYYVMGQTPLSCYGANPISSNHLNTPLYFIFMSGKVNKICFSLRGEKSHKIKVYLYAVNKKDPEDLISQTFKVNFYAWTQLFSWLVILPLMRIYHFAPKHRDDLITIIIGRFYMKIKAFINQSNKKDRVNYRKDLQIFRLSSSGVS